MVFCSCKDHQTSYQLVSSDSSPLSMTRTQVPSILWLYILPSSGYLVCACFRQRSSEHKDSPREALPSCLRLGHMSALIQGRIKIIMHCAPRDALTVTTWLGLVEPGHSGTVHMRVSKTHVQKRLFHGLTVELWESFFSAHHC